jgi:hypothetical protein
MPRPNVTCRNRMQRCPAWLVGARKKKAGSMPVSPPRAFLISLLAFDARDALRVGKPPGTAAVRAQGRAQSGAGTR